MLRTRLTYVVRIYFEARHETSGMPLECIERRWVAQTNQTDFDPMPVHGVECHVDRIVHVLDVVWARP